MYKLSNWWFFAICRLKWGDNSCAMKYKNVKSGLFSRFFLFKANYALAQFARHTDENNLFGLFCQG